jgi:NAD+--asparagine ADP-ribosyltransferase
VPTERKQPAVTSTNAAIARTPFSDEIKKQLEITISIKDSHHSVSSVDIATQYRASYEHRKTNRTLFPILFFLLDAAIINAYRIKYIYKQQQQSELPS